MYKTPATSSLPEFFFALRSCAKNFPCGSDKKISSKFSHFSVRR